MTNIFEFKKELQNIKEQIVKEVVYALDRKRKKRLTIEVEHFKTMKEACEFFGVSRSTVNRWLKEHSLTSIMKGKNRLFAETDLVEFKEKHFREFHRSIKRRY